MKKSLFTVSCLFICVAFAMSASSQPKGKECPMKGMGKCEAMDANKDGKISKEEWTNFHNKMFDDADKNKDGSIDKTEMVEHHKAMMGEKHEMKHGK